MSCNLISPVILMICFQLARSLRSLSRDVSIHMNGTIILDTDEMTLQRHENLSSLGANALNAEVTLQWCDHDDKIHVNIFHGYVHKVSAERRGMRAYLIMQAVSYSARLDQIPKFRVWQKCTLQDICQFLIGQNPNDMWMGNGATALLGGIPFL